MTSSQSDDETNDGIVFEISEICHSLGLRYLTCTEILEHFICAVDLDGRLSTENVKRALHLLVLRHKKRREKGLLLMEDYNIDDSFQLKLCCAIAKLYRSSAADQTRDGCISFKEVVCSIIPLGNDSVKEKIRLSLSLYDINDKGYLTKVELVECISSMLKLFSHYFSEWPFWNVDADEAAVDIVISYSNILEQQIGRYHRDHFMEWLLRDHNIVKLLSTNSYDNRKDTLQKNGFIYADNVKIDANNTKHHNRTKSSRNNKRPFQFEIKRNQTESVASKQSNKNDNSIRNVLKQNDKNSSSEGAPHLRVRNTSDCPVGSLLPVPLLPPPPPPMGLKSHPVIANTVESTSASTSVANRKTSSVITVEIPDAASDAASAVTNEAPKSLSKLISSEVRESQELLGLTGFSADDFMETVAEYARKGRISKLAWRKVLEVIGQLDGADEERLKKIRLLGDNLFATFQLQYSTSGAGNSGQVHRSEREASGIIDIAFVDVVVGVTILTDSPLEDKLMVIFTLLDSDNDRHITSSELKLFLSSVVNVLLCCSPTAKGILGKHAFGIVDDELIGDGHMASEVGDAAAGSGRSSLEDLLDVTVTHCYSSVELDVGEKLSFDSFSFIASNSVEYSASMTDISIRP